MIVVKPMSMAMMESLRSKPMPKKMPTAKVERKPDCDIESDDGADGKKIGRAIVPMTGTVHMESCRAPESMLQERKRLFSDVDRSDDAKTKVMGFAFRSRYDNKRKKSEEKKEEIEGWIEEEIQQKFEQDDVGVDEDWVEDMEWAAEEAVLREQERQKHNDMLFIADLLESRDERRRRVRRGMRNGDMEGGGCVFKWYSRPVFNKILAQMGVDEACCSERQCMRALAAVSLEVKKYPMVTDRLTAYAGPQCYAHLDPSSPEYRVHANEQREDAGRRRRAAWS